MRFKEPSWWYGETASGVWPKLMRPLAAVYGTLAGRRMQQPATYRPRIPVICVGNFTSGGTGKTPFVRTIIAALRLVGHQPVVLSRGYGGTIVGPHWVDATRDTAAEVGDEPLLLAADMPVMIARDRARGARAIENPSFENSAQHAATVIVMDDGIQNPLLHKTLTVAMLDAVRGIGNGYCVPAGPLRAPLLQQLPFVQVIVLNHGGPDDGRGSRAVGFSASDVCAQFDGPILSAAVEPASDLGWLKGQPVVAYAGIGVPDKFFATLGAAGAKLHTRVAFPDHHAFTSKDAVTLLAQARAASAVLVTTEKDHIRLRGLPGPLADLHAASRVLPIDMRLDALGQEKLANLIATYVPLPR